MYGDPKHGKTSIMAWACFSYYGVGLINWMNGVLDQHDFYELLLNDPIANCNGM